MRAEFSELSFAFGLVSEISKSNFFGKIIGPPIFPNLNQEASLGYDVKLLKGKSLFLQFKLSEEMVSALSKEWYYYNQPYFRIKLHPNNKSKQHNLLVNLANIYGNAVFYSAPMFISNIDLNKYFMKNNILKNTKFINCKNLKTISGNQKHSICFVNHRKSMMFSDPFNIESSFNGEEVLGFISDQESISYETFTRKIDSFIKNITKDNISPFNYLVNNGIMPFFLIDDKQTYNKVLK